jgi:glycolate oxidase FAD binding subunit
MEILYPRDQDDLCQIISGAAANGDRLELCGGRTKDGFGAPRKATLVSMAAISGIVDYDPAELTLTVRPGTPLTEVEALVAAEGQMLAFEPWGEARATIGGSVAAGVAGSRRVTAGSARDHLLGFSAVSGRGTSYVAGAKVVKNVTGYDLPKLMAGSWGRIGAMTELTLKVLPAPRLTFTLMAREISPRAAHAAMACALGSNAEVSAAAHLQTGEILLRVAGFAPSVEARCAALPALLRHHCALERLDEVEAAPLWRIAMTGNGLAGAARWRVHLPPRHAPDLIDRLTHIPFEWSMDWGGGLIWIATDDLSDTVRQEAARLNGIASLVSAPLDMRSRIPAPHPSVSGVAALEQRVRRSFDPQDVFVTGRFMEDARADQLSV